ncbi:MAG: 50S ribosomal protein L9 [Bacteriovoracia bacterium]
MKVILLEKVKNLGNIGQIVSVAEGFARNFLMPRKLALVADEKNSNVLKDRQKALSKKIAAEQAGAVSIKGKLDGITIEMIKKVGQNGKLFGSVTTQDVSKELETKGIHVERRAITIEGSVKSVGVYDCKARLFGNDVVANFKLKIAIDPVQAEELKKAQAEAAKRNADKKKAKADAEAAAKAAAEAEAAAANSEE